MMFFEILDLDLLILSIVEQLYIKENRLNLDYLFRQIWIVGPTDLNLSIKLKRIVPIKGEC